jgi:hypothetical protein
MKIDVAKTAQENLIALIVAANPGKELAANQFTAAAPVVIPDDAGRNTTITLSAVVGQGYGAGDATFKYTRLSLAGVNVTPVTSVRVVDGDDEAATLTKVLAATGILASEVDASDYNAPTDDSVPGMITLTPKAGSTLYVGEEVVIELTWAAEAEPTLGETFTVTDLDGFEPA